MIKLSPLLPALVLTSLLLACGGSGSTGGGPGPTPAPESGRSSISGVISSPGAVGAAALPLATRTAPWGQRASWWTDRAAVRALQVRRGVGADGIIPGEFIVKRRTGVSAQALGTLSVGGVTLTRTRDLGALDLSVYRVTSGPVPGGSTAADTARLLAARPDVMSAEPNRMLHVLRTPNDEYYPYQWDALSMKLPAAWDRTTGKAVTVAVVDTGIVKHPDLTGKILPGLDMVSDVASAGDGDGIDTDPTDMGGESSYHGTHVAGTVGAASNNAVGVSGVSWGARIVPVRALGVDGSGSLDDILIGTYWAAGGHVDGLKDNPNPASVVNLSLGGSGPCSPSEQDVFDTLAKNNVITVVAAGNDDVDAADSSPANCANVIAVGATGPDNKRAFYSNYGARIDVMAPGGNMQLKLRLNGEDVPGGILSTLAVEDAGSVYATYDFYQGTSMAAPHVAGLVALMKGEQPGLTFAQTLARLKATSTPLSDAACGVPKGCGAGLVTDAALDTSTPTPTPSPTPTPAPTPVGQIRTLVVALYQLPSGYDSDRSALVVVDQKALRDPYTLGGLEAGTYTVAGWQDINGNQEIDEGEPFGLHYDAQKQNFDVEVDTVSRSIIGIDIDLEPYHAAAATSAGAPSDRAAAQVAAVQANTVQAVDALTRAAHAR